MNDGSALLVMDFINEIVHQDGKFAGDGYLEQVLRGNVLDNAASAIARARRSGIPVIYVVVGFSPGYPEWSPASPIFDSVRDDQRLLLGTWATQVHDALAPEAGEQVVVKHRLSPFCGTDLELLLRAAGIRRLLLTGVATDLVVLSTARDAHDRDYVVEVLQDATATANEQLQEMALRLIARTATISTVEQALPLS
jgi:nicotinamidase-related amidase